MAGFSNSGNQAPLGPRGILESKAFPHVAQISFSNMGLIVSVI